MGDRLWAAGQGVHLRGVRAGHRRGVHRSVLGSHHRQLGGLPGADRGVAARRSDSVYAILDNRNVHRALDGLLFSLGHPCWAFVFQSVYAAYLNLIQPWWKTLRSLALK